MQISADQKLLAIVAHISFFLGGMGFLVAPLVIYLIKKDDPFVQYHAKQALVAHLVLLVISTAIGLACFLFVGLLLLPLIPLLFLFLVVTSLIASYRAFNGELYDYPLIQPLVAWLD